MSRDYGPHGRCQAAIGACNEPGVATFYLPSDLPEYEKPNVRCAHHLRGNERWASDRVRDLENALAQRKADRDALRAALASAGIERDDRYRKADSWLVKGVNDRIAYGHCLLCGYKHGAAVCAEWHDGDPTRLAEQDVAWAR